MSDDLVKRLREGGAISLDELEAKLRESALSELSAIGQAMDAHQAQIEAEAKLSKAVSFLDDLYEHQSYDGGDLIALLRELTGDAE